MGGDSRLGRGGGHDRKLRLNSAGGGRLGRLGLARSTGEATAERTWPLPLWQEYGELVKSDVADIKNTGGRPAGAITAGYFLKEFAGKTPWAHIDIAGTAWTKKAKPYIPKGATGVGVRLLVEVLEQWDRQT